MTASAELLLDGPRGRRMCLELAMELDPDIRTNVLQLGHELDPASGTSRVMLTFDVPGGTADPLPAWSKEQLAAALTSLELMDLDDELMQRALQESVAAARYWQEPDGEDILAGLPEVRAALSPIAKRIMATPGAQWYRQSRCVEQWAIDWRAPDDPAPLPGKPGQALKEWAHHERAEEVRSARERPRDPRANWSGTWWSIPPGLTHTVGYIPDGLDLVEDSPGSELATVIPVRGAGSTYEVRTAEDWVSLCRTYPLEVTASRRHDWFRATGRDGRWVIPDWERVTADWDAVHLTVLGYLSGATRALQVDTGTASVIAGWDPGSTIWLTDVASEWGTPRQTWHRSAHDERWTRTP